MNSAPSKDEERQCVCVCRSNEATAWDLSVGGSWLSFLVQSYDIVKTSEDLATGPPEAMKLHVKVRLLVVSNEPHQQPGKAARPS